MTDLPTTTTRSIPSMLMDPQGFDQMYRVGKMLASSVLFPEHLRKGTAEQAAANGALVMNMAMRLNEDPLTVAQNIYFVGGKPGWSSSYMISKANQHGVFDGTIQWDVKGKGDDLSVTAYAIMKDTGKRVQATCDMEMARAEGWTKNAKYKSMPEQMLRYRSATFLIRLYCPEVMVGVPSQIEIELGGEMKDVTPREFTHAEPSDGDARDEDKQPETVEGQVVEDAAGDDRKASAVKEPEPKAEAGPTETKAETAPETQKATEPETAKTEPRNAPDPAQFQSLADMIKRDLNDAPSVQDVIDLYQPQLEQMEQFAPEVHADLKAEFEAYRKNETAG